MTKLAISAAQRRLLVLASTAFFVVSVYLCTTRLFAMDYTPLATHKRLTPSGDVVELSRADLPMSYGSYGRPVYDNITLLGKVPDKYIPTRWNNRRLIVIGDVHGMIDQLNALLELCKYDETWDHVISVGDMVNKGPDSAAVVARFMGLGASAVRGNHEDRVLLAWGNLGLQKGLESDLVSQEAEAHRGESMDLQTARSLNHAQLDWLRSLPVILTADPLNMYIVHAGLVPGVALEKQDPWAVMNMRTMRYPREEYRQWEGEKKKKEAAKKAKENQAKREDEGEKKLEDVAKAVEETMAQTLPSEEAATGEQPAAKARRRNGNDPSDEIVLEKTPPDHDIWIPTDSHDHDLWTDLWNREQRRVEKSHRRTVVYGHDARRGYRENPYTFGLDSACVNGGVLSAFIITADDGGGGCWKHTTFQVPCKTEAAAE